MMACSEMESQDILVVGGAEPLQRVVPLLARAAFAVRHAATAAEAEARLRQGTFDLLVVRHPVAGGGMERLLAAIREPRRPSFSAALLVLADEDAAGELGPLLGRGRTRVLSAAAPAERLLATVAELLAAVPRGSVRVELAVSLRWSGDDEPVAGETVNVSRNGLLVRAAARPPLGATLAFEIDLPGRRERCRGTGEVVRHAGAEGPGPGEFAVRILALDAVSQRLLEELHGPS